MDDLVKKYNNLCLFFVEKMADKNTVVKIFVKLVQLKLLVTPTYLITTSGPFVYKFREKISSSNMAFFATHDYESQMADWKKLAHGHDFSIVQKLRDTIIASLKKQID